MSGSESSPERALRWILSGRVQGVGFRYFTRQAAASLGVSGSVRNRPDGTVEVEVFGPVERVEAFRARLLRGPPAGRVERLQESELREATPPAGFDVRF